MHPILFHWGPFTLHTYGLFAASGVFGRIRAGHKRHRETKGPPPLPSSATRWCPCSSAEFWAPESSM
jgi:prolipoprotein diacylglyceryltransferase